ncbi:Hypothetical predicted protein [Mytilus galloprovincialis]|uniref:Uncharacterized protein n=1 Tax=Mytilus galloprovincialis TaxID=29158 RepID=A0A8B6HKA5_MYTGA|nr:Hypothetical predicted protein [Mytilus galloprovincialis]
MDDDNAVAIIGIACRFPGADDTDEFMKNLEEGKCFIDEVPKGRWNSNKADVRDSDESWKDRSKYAALINEHDKWDNKFFGVSDSEAAWMNPQHCLALEVTHSAIENAGITLDQIKGTKTGVFIGAMNDDFLLGLPSSRHELNNFVVTGMAPSITSNRISYQFDLQGPSLTLDTACSSALVAVHLGCQSIRSGEIETAVCGGVNIILTPLTFIPLSKAKMISPTGKSCAFSKDADGYVRGEGCGIVILKNYKKAVKDGDRIWSLIATGCNQDGHSNTPITAPSSSQQQALLQDIYTKFRVDPASIQYIETHGTGTPVGDPIEVNALATFFAPHLNDEKLIPIGSVKTNIGHLESSAGTAGLIKTILMMKSGKFFPYLNFKPENANPKIDFGNIPFKVIQASEKWLSSDDGSRIACINSFGFGGTNCHAIIRQLKTDDRQTACKANLSAYILICFSAKSLPALVKILEHAKGRISVFNYRVEDISYTSLLKRSHFKYRFSCAVSNMDELQSEISTQIKTIKKKSLNIKDDPFLIFVFCGVGTVWLGMCQRMLESYIPFHEKFLQIDKILTTYTGFSIINVVRKPPENLATDPYRGPLLIFACQVSLFHLWSALGVKVDCIIGQSVGEVAAAHVSGCLNLQDAVKVIFYRSILSAKASGGSMMVIGNCNVEEIQKLCDESDSKVCIAVYSSREACVISGDTDAICNIKEKLEREKPHLLKKELDVGCAYHSYHMDSISKEIEKELTDISGKKPHTFTISTVTGKVVDDNRMGTPSYWTQNIREPVLQREAISNSLRKNAHNIIVEIGPKPVIKAHLKNITDDSATCVTSMNQPNEQKSFVSALGILYENCVYIDWRILFNGNENIVDFPRYKFNRNGNLLGALSLQAGLRVEFNKTGIHPFVSQVPMSKDFHVDITPIVAPYVYEHRVHNQNIAPGAVYGDIGLTAATQILDLTVFQVEISLHFIRPLAVGKDQSIELQTHIKDQNYFEVKRKGDVICKGKMCKAERQPLKFISVADSKKRCQTHLKSSFFYKQLKSLGFEYGESLRVIGDCYRSDDEFVAEMILPSSVCNSLNRHSLHPSILDGALQTVVLCYQKVETQDRPIPVKISSLRVCRPMESNLFVIGKKSQTNTSGSLLDLFIVNIFGDIVVEVKSYEVMNINRDKQQFNISDKLYHITWTPVNIDQNVGDNGKTLFITFSSEAKRSLKNVFGQENDFVIGLPFDHDRVSVQELLEVLFKYIESQFVRIGEISQICYFPGLACRSTDQNANEIFVAVKISCVVLTHLIQYLVKRQVIDVPIYILTKQTQQKTSKSIENNTWVNVIGSELWGMVRCILRERMLSNLRLIDFEKDSDLLLVRKIMFNPDRDQWRKTSEYKIDNQRLYINQICRLSTDEPSHRKNTFNKKELLELRCIHNESFEDLIFVPKRDILSNKAICSSYVKLEVLSVFCSDTWTPKTITHSIGDLDQWTHYSKDGHEIILSEVSGFLESNQFDSSSTSCFSRSKKKPIRYSKQRECISCFPCIASNTVFVPENCVIEKTLFPMYRPGMLLEVVMYFYLLTEIKDRSPLIALIDTELSLNGSLLECVFQYSKREIIYYNNTSSLTTALLPAKFQIILLTNNYSRIEKLLSNLSQKEMKVYSFSGLLNKAMERKIRHRFPNVALFLINCDQVLCQDTLPEVMFEVRRWLSAKQTMSILLGIKCPTNTSGYILSFEQDLNGSDNHLVQNIPVVISKYHMFSKHATYIIIGGLTGLGWEILKAIAARSGGVLITISRRLPNDQQLQNIEEVRIKYGCVIEYIKADISVFDSISNAFIHIKETFPEQAIKGIFHGAAVVDDALLPDMTEDKFDKVLRPKVIGTWNLHLLAKDLTLDFFVLHSSISSAFGNAGQTNYGAGNAFKDAVAFHRRGLGIAGQSINWGALKLGLVQDKTEEYLKSQGFPAMKETEIVHCFIHSLFINYEQVVCGVIDWKTVIHVSPDMLHLTARLQTILEDLNLIDSTVIKQSKISYIKFSETDELLTLSTGKKQTKVLETVSQIAADACAVDLSMIQPKTTLLSLGIDSMKGMSFINNVYKYISCKISIIAILEGEATIESISDLIFQQIQIGDEVDDIGNHERPVNEKKTTQSYPKNDGLEDIKCEVMIDNENNLNTTYYLSVINGEGPRRLHWRTREKENVVYFTDIENSQIGHLNGLTELLIETRKEKFVFKSADTSRMQKLATQLTDALTTSDSTYL